MVEAAMHQSEAYVVERIGEGKTRLGHDNSTHGIFLDDFLRPDSCPGGGF
jgi:hypothetical protein